MVRKVAGLVVLVLLGLLLPGQAPGAMGSAERHAAEGPSSSGGHGPAARSAARSRRRPCTPRGTTTLAGSRTVRVYEDRSGRVFGCLKRQNKRRLLRVVNEIDDALVSVRTAGNYVAWNLVAGPACRASCPPDVTSTSTVSFMNLRSGRGRSVEAQPAAGLKLSSKGVVAWVQGDPPASEVRALSRLGATTLDSGDIDASSLRLHGATVSWIRDGERRSATVGAG